VLEAATKASSSDLAYHPWVTRYFSIDAANELLPQVHDLLERLRDEREQLVALRDEAAERLAVVGIGGSDEGTREIDEAAVHDDLELRAIRLRMQGLIDQMQAAVSQLDAWDVVLRDIPTGLIDFPALASGRQVWLCWRLGEGPVDWWHPYDQGFSARRPLAELPTALERP
jgi:hypothetical protein